IGFRSDGRPIWPVARGAVDEPDTDTGYEPDADTGDEPDPEGSDQLGDPGKKALDRMKQRLKETKQRARELEAELKKIQSQPKKDETDEPDVEAIRREAAEQARAELLRDRVVDKIEARAARKFVDPEDAAAILLRSHEVDDFIEGGRIDAEA